MVILSKKELRNRNFSTKKYQSFRKARAISRKLKRARESRAVWEYEYAAREDAEFMEYLAAVEKKERENRTCYYSDDDWYSCDTDDY